MRNRKSAVTPVFYISLAIAFVFILWGAIFPANLETNLGYINNFISNELGWGYMLALTGFVIFAFVLVTSADGQIRLGQQDEKPQYSYSAWLSFLFTARMGVGPVFYAVNEPLTHFPNPPITEGRPALVQHEALQYTLFHWGYH